ncbi:protocadherin-20 isoform X2 [Anarrhichthys ocellatus]|uniref:protocadherin-20 isoform X2 n=1 Tax=Anarrhichthys ocellatus TaxID=433405 RepID=UPI0012EE69B3|nr:protocadherin-11 X-linked-like isoform X2 [Anarrhichthys ocellatus]
MGHGTPDNMNWAGLLQNLLVVVHLQQFICGSVRFSIPEEQEPGSLAGSLSKHFPPQYQLLTQEYLWMDKNTGNFYTTEQKMDRETLCPEETKAEECIILHNAVVGPSGDLIQFPVIIEDINDNAPHFENSEIHLRVSEDMTVGTSFILDDQAQDRDAGPNGELHYRLEDSDGVFSLKVEEDGPFIMLVVQTALDRETRDMYHMALVATDCGSEPLSATATLIVTVTDVNDNCPSFSADSPRNVTVPGDSPKNMLVARVRATDQDSGPNAAIVYSLSPKVSERAKKLFSLDSVTGHIRLTQDLQSDISEVLLLNVLASGHHCPPADTQSHYQLEVEENNQPGMSLLRVSASDADSGYNGRVTYRLDKHTSTIFNIAPETGQLSVSAVLDREQQGVYNLTVFAQDSGSPPLESVATVSIRVLDHNDNAPVFLTPHFIFFIREDVPPFAQVGGVGVTDPDEGENGNTELHVVNSSGPFVVDNTDGTLRTTNNLDRETDDRYELYLLASDHGRPFALTSTARVTIFVEDINDNQPKVILPSSNSSCQTVSPATIAGTIIAKIYAIDEDSGLNSEITYTVVAPESVRNSSPFRLDSRSGNITVAQQFLQKDLGMHHLFIVVRDGGKPAPLYTTIWVNLLVNESVGPCNLDRAPTWTGTSDLHQTPSKAPICEVEDTRSAQLTLLVGLGMMLVSTCLLVATVVLYLKQKRRSLQQNKRGHIEEIEIPLRLKDKYYSDD